MGASQWHMHRFGLVDFWCYDNEEFTFSNGHMLLRGSNGSGKSVTMQSLIPLLLDGNRSSERLDSFGSRSRKMDTYLIDEHSDREERIGYLYLEFKRAESKLYKTIGMGMRARKNKPLDVWYFVIEDNRRVNIDFNLMDNHLTLSRRQLENILGDQVILGQKEYMRKVNEALFGFSNLDDYKDAIDLLLQLRSPKLSNSLSPDKLNEILAMSLQPLSDDDLRPMSDAITSMDNLQDDLENLNISFQAANKISQAYDIYNQAMLIDKWSKYCREKEKYVQIEKQLKEEESVYLKVQQECQRLQETRKQNETLLEIKNNEKRILMDPNIERLHEELLRSKQYIQEYQQQFMTKQKQYDSKCDRIMDLKANVDTYGNNVCAFHREYQQAMSLLDEIISYFPFSEHSALKDAMTKQEDFDFDYTKKCLKEEEKKTQELINSYQQYENKLLKITEIENEIISQDRRKIESLQHLQNAKEAYGNCLEEYQEYFYQFHQHNSVLKLSEEMLHQMMDLLGDYEIHQDYHRIHDIVYQQYMRQNEQFMEEKNNHQFQLQELRKQYDAIDQEYHYWLEKKDYEPQRDALTLKHRAYLKEINIDFIPFYQLLDFEECVNDDDKNKIEELLSQMHLLDALVISKEHKELLQNLDHKGHDHYLWTDANLKDLTTVKLSYPFDQKQLVNVFAALKIINYADVEIKDRYFQSGVLEGVIDQGEVSCLISYERRKLLRQQMLDNLLKEKTELSKRMEAIREQIRKIEEQIPLLKKEMADFKDERAIKAAYDEIDKLQKELSYLETKINQLLDQKKEESRQSKLLYQDIQKSCQYLLLDVTKEALEERREAIDEYRNGLDKLKDALTRKEHYQQLYDIEQDKMLEIQNDVDTLHYEIEQVAKQKAVLEGKAASIQKELDTLGYHDLHLKLECLDQEIRSLQQAIKDCENESTKMETQQAYREENMKKRKEELEYQRTIQNQYHEVLLQEASYGFVFSEDECMEKNMKKFVNSLKGNKNIADYLTNLQTVFFEQIAYLSQYHLTHQIDPLCCQLDDVQGHFLIKASNQGKMIPFKDLLTILQERIDTQKLLIMEEDRHIFEEILVNTIGEKIRSRIQSSKRWVEKMERYMQEMNTSSGLQLSLKWRSKKASDDDEMDTQELVELLEKDYRILKNQDRQKISQHFRTKIDKARRMSIDDNTTASFHQLIRDVMDYRKWFEFVLYANKTNESKKELTRRIFYAYSGGEKAIAMYVPLFSAVAAKFESARDDAPRMIALDEAFAGVDENNIDNMFALIAKFDFDYIMNSQVLWGDYPSCESLAIYELFRPNNAPYVTKVAYEWNGHVKKVVIK